MKTYINLWNAMDAAILGAIEALAPTEAGVEPNPSIALSFLAMAAQLAPLAQIVIPQTTTTTTTTAPANPANPAPASS